MDQAAVCGTAASKLAHEAFDTLRAVWSECVDEGIACPTLCSDTVDMLVQECSAELMQDHNAELLEQLDLHVESLDFETTEAGLGSLKKIHGALVKTAGAEAQLTGAYPCHANNMATMCSLRQNTAAFCRGSILNVLRR